MSRTHVYTMCTIDQGANNCYHKAVDLQPANAELLCGYALFLEGGTEPSLFMPVARDLAYHAPSLGRENNPRASASPGRM